MKNPAHPAPESTPRHSAAPCFPVSVKGVVLLGGRAVLLRNERDEWELPGGKLEPGEDPPACLAREIAEELGLAVTVGAILDCWRYEVRPGIEVVIVTYGCDAPGAAGLVVSAEHKEVATFAVAEIDGLPMPEGYRRSIRAWASRRA